MINQKLCLFFYFRERPFKFSILPSSPNHLTTGRRQFQWTGSCTQNNENRPVTAIREQTPVHAVTIYWKMEVLKFSCMTFATGVGL